MQYDVREKLCLNFCSYYKSSKDNKLACKGFLVIEKLIEKRKNISFEKSDKRLDAETEEKLIQSLCINCPFYENDCDFVGRGESRGKVKRPPPCGGFILLGHLLEEKIITIDDIKNTD